jgi:hypothetical protein
MKPLLPSLSLTDTARHFIMWDDPDWMFGQLNRFLSLAKPGPVRWAGIRNGPAGGL